jgi:hypothetical protein
MEIILALLQPFIGPLIMGLGAILAIGLAFLKGKSAGKQDEQNKQARASYENERKRENLEDSVRNSSNAERDRLYNIWSRK